MEYWAIQKRELTEKQLEDFYEGKWVEVGTERSGNRKTHRL
jgi:hypothetical protein